MVPKKLTFAFSLELFLIFVTIISMSEASMIHDRYNILRMSLVNSVSNRRLDSPITSSVSGPLLRVAESPPPPPPICRPRTLDPAIQCGCAVFRPDYEGDEQFSLLEERCDEELGFDIPSGFAACPEPDFTDTIFSGQSFVKRRGGFRIGLMRKFFKDTRDECAFPRPLEPLEVRQSAEKWNLDQDSSMSPAFRTPRTRNCKKLRDLCMNVLQRKAGGGLTRKQAFCDCCPGSPRCR